MMKIDANWGSLLYAIVGLLAMAAITIVLEAPIVLFGFRKSEYKRKIPLLIMLNLFTNVILNTIISYFYMDIGFGILVMEIIVFLLEAVVYYLAIYDISKKRAFLVSLIANTVSCVLGTLIIEFSGLYNAIAEIASYIEY